MKKAFTLLELMIVVIIVGILVALAIPQFQGAVIKAKFTEMFVCIRAIEIELEVLLAECGWEQGGMIVPELMSGIVLELTQNSNIFNYSISGGPPGPGPFEIRVSSKLWGPLAMREIYPDERRWIIYDNNPWSKYLNIPGAEYE